MAAHTVAAPSPAKMLADAKHGKATVAELVAYLDKYFPGTSLLLGVWLESDFIPLMSALKANDPAVFAATNYTPAGKDKLHGYGWIGVNAPDGHHVYPLNGTYSPGIAQKLADLWGQIEQHIPGVRGFTTMLEFLTSGQTWTRIGEFAIGAGLVYISFRSILNTPQGRQIQKSWSKSPLNPSKPFQTKRRGSSLGGLGTKKVTTHISRDRGTHEIRKVTTRAR